MTTQANTKALTVIDPATYAVLDPTIDSGEMADILRDNLGGQGLTPRNLDRVTVPAGGGTVWQVPGIDKLRNEETIDGIIVQIQPARAYWSNPDNTGTPPDCASLDMVYGIGMYGRGSAVNPEGLCATCPQDEWGSGREGRGKACRERREVYVLRAEDMLPIVVQVPITSLRALEKYAVALAAGKADRGRSHRLHSVVTRLALEQATGAGKQKYSVIVPSFVQALTPEQARRMAAYAAGLRSAFGGPSLPAEAFDQPDEA
jgi:hypothetical protein